MLNNRQPGQAPAAPVGAADDGSLIWSMIQLIVALGIIIAIIYLSIRFLSSRTNLMRGHVFQRLGTQALTTNRSVHIVSIGDKVYLLGVGENITLLDTINDPDEIERLKAMLQPQQSPTGTGWQGVQDLMARLRPQSKTAQGEEVPWQELPFDATLREKLNNLKEQRQQSVDDLQEGRDRE